MKGPCPDWRLGMNNPVSKVVCDVPPIEGDKSLSVFKLLKSWHRVKKVRETPMPN